eukprot:scaffold243365_cov33-Tisochrysis_lutea.AAC.6
MAGWRHATRLPYGRRAYAHVCQSGCRWHKGRLQDGRSGIVSKGGLAGGSGIDVLSHSHRRCVCPGPRRRGGNVARGVGRHHCVRWQRHKAEVGVGPAL